MRTILHTILVTMLLGGGTGEWAPIQDLARECCCCRTSSGMCCMTPAGTKGNCLCSKTEGNRIPLRGASIERQAADSSQTSPRTKQAQRRAEPPNELATWTRAVAEGPEAEGLPASVLGRDPDLGRHLARLSTLRI